MFCFVLFAGVGVGWVLYQYYWIFLGGSWSKVVTFHTILQVFLKMFFKHISLPGVLLPVADGSFPFYLPKLPPPTLLPTNRISLLILSFLLFIFFKSIFWLGIHSHGSTFKKLKNLLPIQVHSHPVPLATDVLAIYYVLIFEGILYRKNYIGQLAPTEIMRQVTTSNQESNHLVLYIL